MSGASRGSDRTRDESLTILAWPLDRSGENPYTNNLYAALEGRGHRAIEFSFRNLLSSRFDVLHVHWPEGVLPGKPPVTAFLAAVAVGATLAVARVRGASVVWTVHNERPHRPANERALSVLRAGLRRTVSGLLYLSEASREQFEQLQPWAKRVSSAVTPHGRFGALCTVGVEERDRIRATLGVSPDQKLVSFLGRMESYKGPSDLVSAFLRMPDRHDVRLLLAGTIPAGSAGDALRSAVAGTDIILHEAWLDDRRLGELSAASDLVVYPYRRILNSGSVLVPIEYATPVLAPRLGSISEVARLVGSGWIRTYDGSLSAADLGKAIAATTPTAPPDFTQFEWDTVAGVTEQFFRRLRRS